MKSVRKVARVLGVSVFSLVGLDSADSAGTNEGLEEYLRLYLPTDLSDEEFAWLDSAPTSRGPLSPDAYAAILRALRKNGGR